MKYSLSTMILAEPAGLQRNAPWLIFSFRLADEDFIQSCQPLRKIGEEFGCDFAFVAARPKDACNKNPALSFRTQWGKGPSRGETTCFLRKNSIFQNFQRETLVQLHPRRAQ